MRPNARTLPSRVLTRFGLRELPLPFRVRQLAERSDTSRIFDGIAHLAAKYGDAANLSSHEYRVFSQNGEDGVIAEIFHRIGTTNRFFVEFGVEDGRECNAAYLANVCGWSGLFIEADPELCSRLHARYRFNDRVRTVESLVTPESIDQLIRENDAPAEPDLLSIDIDGNDYWVWKAITSLRPRVVVVEYNSGLDPRVGLVQPCSPTQWDRSGYYGASLGALEGLAELKGYRLVHAELAGVNAFFVVDELADLFRGEVTVRSPNFDLRGSHHPVDTHARTYEIVATATNSSLA